MKAKTKKIIRYSLLALVVIVAAAALYIYKEYNRRHKDTAGLASDYQLTATGLISEFEKQEQASTHKYTDKVIEVDGIVKKITKDENGYYTVALGDTVALSSVRCCIDSLHSKEVQSLQEGSPATLKGICTGFNADELLGSDVILVRAVLAKKQTQ